MSLQALTWAMEHAPITDPTCRSILFVMANAADEEGRNAFLSVDRIAYCTGFSERTIRRGIDRMVAETIIRPQADTSLRDAKIKDPGRRPDVYELALHRKRPSYAEYRAQQLAERGVSHSHPSEGGVTEVHPWGVTVSGTGVTVSTEGCHSDTQPVLDPSKDPSLPSGESAPAHEDDDQLSLVGAPAQPAKAKRKTQMPEGWAPDDALSAWTRETAPNLPQRELDAFRAYHQSHGSKFLSWDQAWRTWVFRWLDRQGGRRPGPYRNPPTSPAPAGGTTSPARSGGWGDLLTGGQD